MFKKTKKNRKKILSSDLGKKRVSRKKSSGINFKKIILKIFFHIFLLAFLVGLPYFVFFRDFLSIRNIEVEGTREISSEQIEKEVAEIRDSKWMDLIPKNNIIFPWKKMIKNKLALKYPIFKEIKVRREFPDQLVIQIREREPRLIQVASNLNCVYDENGELFDLTDNFEYLGKADLEVVQLLEEKPFPQCADHFKKDYLEFIFSIKQLLQENLGLELTRFWETPNLVSGDLRNRTGSGWKILLDKNLGAEKEFGMLKLVLESKIDEEGRDELEYIDLRTQNRIYYKLTNQASQEDESEEKEKTSEDEKE